MSNTPSQLRLFPDEQAIHSTGNTRCLIGSFYEDCTSNLTGGTRLKTDSRIAVCPDLRLPYPIRVRSQRFDYRGSRDTAGEVGESGVEQPDLFSLADANRLNPRSRRATLRLRDWRSIRRYLRSTGRDTDTGSPARTRPIHSSHAETFVECKAAGRGNQVILYRTRMVKEADWILENHANVLYFIWCHDVETCTGNQPSITTVPALHSRLLAQTTSLIISPSWEIFRLAQSNCTLRKVNNGIPKTKGTGGFRVTVKDYGIGWCLPTSKIKQECGLLGFSPLLTGTPFEKAIQVFYHHTIPYDQVTKIFDA